jgi:hypothetical protein
MIHDHDCNVDIWHQADSMVKMVEQWTEYKDKIIVAVYWNETNKQMKVLWKPEVVFTPVRS